MNGGGELEPPTGMQRMPWPPDAGTERFLLRNCRTPGKERARCCCSRGGPKLGPPLPLLMLVGAAVVASRRVRGEQTEEERLWLIFSSDLLFVGV